MPNSFSFDKTLQFLDGDASIEISDKADPVFLNALATNTPFPSTGEFVLDSAKFSGTVSPGDQYIKFLDPAGATVAFKASGSLFAGLGLYRDPANMLKALPIDANAGSGESSGLNLNLLRPDNAYYLMLNWGYDLSGSGNVALGGTVSVDISAQGETERVLAVARLVPNATGGRDAVTDLVRSFYLPTRVQGFNQLKPGTWLIAEVSGSVALSLALTYGHDFNWVREIPGPLGSVLSGDIGLRIQAGLSATLGFSAQGKYLVVLSRDPAPSGGAAPTTIRVRIFKLRKQGMSFALNAGLDVIPSVPLPATPDDLIAAVLGVHHQELLKDLQALENWTDTTTPLSQSLASAGLSWAKDFLQKAMGVNDQTLLADLARARQQLVNFLNAWNNLPEQAAGIVYKAVSNQKDLADILSWAQGIAGLTQGGFAGFLEQKLSDITILNGPVGQWLESVLSAGVLGAVTNSKEFSALQDLAKKTVSVLDGDVIQQTLTKLQGYIDSTFGIGKIVTALQTAANPNQLDAWLQKKLADFLGKQPVVQDLGKLQNAIASLRKNLNGIYSKVRTLLNQKYSFDLAYTYQKTTTGTALADISFDLGVAPASAVAMQQLVKNGDVGQFMMTPIAGVHVQSAVLTHEVDRHSHVELTIPSNSLDIDHLNTATATVQTDDSRMLIYNLTAKDDFNVQTSKSRRDSVVSLGAYLESSKPDNALLQSTAALSYSYSFLFQKQNMAFSELTGALNPIGQTYFSGHVIQGSFADWLGSFSNSVQRAAPAGSASAQKLGPVWTTFQASVPASVCAAWFYAPPFPGHEPLPNEYIQMSLNLQEALKQFIPRLYFANLKNYTNLDAAAPLLAYQAIPPMTSFQRSGNTVTPDGAHPYWDPTQRDQLDTMLALGFQNLTKRLAAIYDALNGSPDYHSSAQFYDPSGGFDGLAMQRIRNATALDTTGCKTILLPMLLMESQMIEAAVNAGVSIANIRDHHGFSPATYLNALDSFGGRLAAIFNDPVGGVYLSGGQRTLATALFVIASTAIADTSKDYQQHFSLPSGPIAPVALLSAARLNAGAAFPSEGPPPSNSILVAQSLVSPGPI
jgi:hypothetical protein